MPHRASVLAALLLAAACTEPSREPGPPAAEPTSPGPTATAPAPPGRPTGFVAFGDFGGGPGQREVADAMARWAAARPVAALVTTGDNVYPDGDPARFAAVLDAPYAGLRRSRPLWATLGNHDVQAGHGPAQLRHLGLPDLPYEQRLGPLQLLFLDGNRVDREQTRWLRERLDRAQGALRVVVFHQPAYSCSRHGGTRRVQREWAPLLERARATLVLSGHDHNYQRFTSPNGVTYVVTGGGGKDLYRVRPGCERAVRQDAAVAAYHFVAVETVGQRLRLSAVSTDGSTLDTAELPPAAP